MKLIVQFLFLSMTAFSQEAADDFTASPSSNGERRYNWTSEAFLNCSKTIQGAQLGPITESYSLFNGNRLMIGSTNPKFYVFENTSVTSYDEHPQKLTPPLPIGEVYKNSLPRDLVLWHENYFSNITANLLSYELLISKSAPEYRESAKKNLKTKLEEMICTCKLVPEFKNYIEIVIKKPNVLRILEGQPSCSEELNAMHLQNTFSVRISSR